MTLLSRAVIPTNSLILIEQEAGEEIAPLIQYIRASSTMSDPTLKEKPHEHVIFYRVRSNRVEVKFNRGKSREEFNISAVEALIDRGFPDAWVHRLVLRIRRGGAVWDFEFRNTPITEGSKAAQWVARYLRDLKALGWIEKIQLRHLPLMTVSSVPAGSIMSLEDTGDPALIAWLRKVTGGLVKTKTVKRVDAESYIDVDIRDTH